MPLLVFEFASMIAIIPDSSFLLRRELDTKTRHALPEAKALCVYYTSLGGKVGRHVPPQLDGCAPTHVHLCGTLCTCGVVHSSGVNTWRDQLKPTQLLQNVARFKGFPPPVLSEDGSRIRYGGRDYHLDEFGEHRAAGCMHNIITHFCAAFG